MPFLTPPQRLQPLFPPADQAQSVRLRAALLRALEQAKKNGALGRDAILRKTMLDECRGERFEEILAVFSSAVLKKVVAEEDAGPDAPGSMAAARALALENRGYASDRTQLHVLVLAHRASLGRMLRHKAIARAQYKDFAELLALKERSIARRREEQALSDDTPAADALSEDARLHLQRLVRNNWSGSESWMDALLYGDDKKRKDGLLSASPDRVWRRVQAGRLGELESKSDSGLVEQLEKRVAAQRERLQQLHDFRRHVFGSQGSASTVSQPSVIRPASTAERTGIDLGFGAHEGLRPGLMSPRKVSASRPSHGLKNEVYAGLLGSFQDELHHVDRPQQDRSHLVSLLGARKPRKATTVAEEPEPDIVETDISDIDEHPIGQHSPPQPLPVEEESPSRRRVLLTKKSLTFSIASYHSDEEPEPPGLPLPPQKMQRAATLPTEQPIRPAGPGRRRLIQKEPQKPLPIRRRHQSPPIRPPPVPREDITPSPDRSPPPPSPPLDDDDEEHRVKVLVSTPDHSIKLHPPLPSDDDSFAAAAGTPTQDIADQILASMSNASPPPVMRPRHTLSLAERTRMSMARASRSTLMLGGRVVDSDGEDTHSDDGEPAIYSLAAQNANAASQSQATAPTSTANDAGAYEDLVARTRKSMVGSEAARQKAQLARRRSQRPSRQSSLGVGGGSLAAASGASRHDRHFPPLDEGDDDTTVLAEELMSGGQDDAEAIFRSRPKIKMSPIPSPTRELEDE